MVQLKQFNHSQRLSPHFNYFYLIAKKVQTKYPKIVEPAWLLATSADLEWLGNEEATSLPERFASWYMPKLLSTIPNDPLVHKTFIQVQNLIVPPTFLFAPKIAWRVLRHSLGT